MNPAIKFGLKLAYLCLFTVWYSDGYVTDDPFRYIDLIAIFVFSYLISQQLYDFKHFQ